MGDIRPHTCPSVGRQKIGALLLFRYNNEGVYMILRVKKLDQEIPIPAYAHSGDAGLDLFAREEYLVKAGKRVLVRTGVAMEIPRGYVGLIWDKSGLANSHGLKVLGGVVDAGYRGEIKVGLLNTGNKDYKIEKYHKVAQMLIQKVERLTVKEAKELSEATRGEDGFGSTGEFSEARLR